MSHAFGTAPSISVEGGSNGAYLAHNLQDASQSPSRRAGSHSPRQQPGLSLAALPAIPETPEGAMQRALSSGEEGRRGQRAYASFMHSSGSGLDLVSLGGLSRHIDPFALAVLTSPMPWHIIPRLFLLAGS